MHSIYVNDLWLDLRLHAKREAVEYIIANMPEAMVLADRNELLKFAFSRAPKEGLVVEFGVAKGESVRNLAAQTTRQVHGFDSFGGLPEDWSGTKEQTGAFTARGKLPKVP
ncbi:MAG: class I SAM-dependent methyltransferase, partial [Acidocella sp.]|nr:class I SAM-dependent methyltransferase [Acidocella sp.]